MSLYKQPGSENYFYEFTANGARYRKSTGTSVRREAERIEARAKLEAKAQPDTRVRRGTLCHVAQQDIARKKEHGKSTGYVTAITRYWVILVEHFSDVELASITHEHVDRFIATMRERGHALKSIKEYIGALRRGFDLGQVELPKPWPVLRVKGQEPNEQRKGKLREVSDLRMWLADLPEDARCMATVALCTGIRREELRRMDRSWIDARGQIHLPAWATKGKSARTVPLVGPALEAFERACELRGSDIPFEGRDHKTTYTRASERLGIALPVTLRDLRHTFATWAYEGSAGDERAVNQVMGHAEQTTADRYHTVSNERIWAVVRAAVRKYPYPTPHRNSKVVEIRRKKG